MRIRQQRIYFYIKHSRKKVSYYNAVTGSISVINAEYSTNKTTFTFKLPANTTGFSYSKVG